MGGLLGERWPPFFQLFLYQMLHHLLKENKKNLNDTDCESLLLHLHHLGFACFRSNNPDGSFYLFVGYTLALDLRDVNAFIFGVD